MDIDRQDLSPDEGGGFRTSTGEAAWRSVLDADGGAYTVHEHAPAHSVAERQALPFPWSQAVKTLAFTTADTPLLLVALRAEDRIDFARLAAAVGASRSQLRATDAEALGAEGLVPGGIPPVSHRPGVPCWIDTAVIEVGQPVFCGAGSADRTLQVEPAVLARLPRAHVTQLRR
ncbi:YbaK/EbsC family protein [Streptomyces sp. NPDC048441]|uniref:YbaK/EbsC family protein n=1 Tax=Streptomyces sp. NPDC048441 TaxID=3365552 RepID=UPI003716EB1D